jgi:hypothetical protein
LSYRPQITPYKVIEDGDMSTARITSEPTIVQKLSQFSYQYVWSGSSPVGVVTVEASNDFELDATGAVKNTGHWNTISFSYNGTIVTDLPVSGNTGQGLLEIETKAFALRTVYARTSGTGTLNVTAVGKVA